MFYANTEYSHYDKTEQPICRPEGYYKELKEISAEQRQKQSVETLILWNVKGTVSKNRATANWITLIGSLVNVAKKKKEEEESFFFPGDNCGRFLF